MTNKTKNSMIKDFKIPAFLCIGGQDLWVKEVLRCNDNNLGRCNLAAGEIQIAQTFNSNGDYEVSNSSKQNTFCHEIVHAILDTMGENELSGNEKFVCCFSGYLTEVVQQIVRENVQEAYLSAAQLTKECNTCRDK